MDVKQKMILKNLSQEIKPELREKIFLWAKELDTLRNHSKTEKEKAVEAVRITLKYDIVIPFIKELARLLKDFLWQNRSIKGKLGLIGVSVGSTIFGGQSAGLAALGGAIGLPLWLVLGAGGVFLGAIIEEFKHD